MSATRAMLAAGAATGAGARQASIAHRPANGTARGPVAPAAVPLRRGARAWGARPRARRSRALIAAATDGSDDGSDDAARVDPASFGRTARRMTIVERGVDSGSSIRRTAQAAVVVAAAMFGGVGVAHAAASSSAADASRGGATSSVVGPSHHRGAADRDAELFQIADADDDKEAAARAKKLAEVRRIKQARKEKMEAAKKKNKGEDDDKGGKKGGKGGKATAEDKELAKELAERKRQYRIEAAKKKAFAAALERERAAVADELDSELPIDESAYASEETYEEDVVEEGKGKEGMFKKSKKDEDASGEERRGLSVGGISLPTFGLSAEERAERAQERAYREALKLDNVDRVMLGDEPELTVKQKITKFLDENIPVGRFTRNVNLTYLRDPFAVKGTKWAPCEMSYTGFYDLCEVGRVKRVEYMPNMNTVKFFLYDTDEVFYANLPYDPTLYKLLIEKKIDVISKQHSPLELFFRGLAHAGAPMILLWFIFIIWQDMKDDTTEGSTLMNTGTAKTYSSTPEFGMNMDDIAGIDVIRQEMDELISYLRDYQRYVRAGASIPMGVLLCGPPGTGKTLLARCLAGEAGVPFFACAGTEFMEMFVGVGAARIRNLFNQARKCRPCIIFIDEFDSVAVRRKDAAAMEGNDEQVATINQLLTEMDGFGGNSGVMVFAATNRPHVIDPALIRPGRFDRVIEMPLPNREARMDIIDLHCSYQVFEGMIDPDLDVALIARQCAGFTGADLENLVRTAAQRNSARLKKERKMAGDRVFLDVIDEIRRSNVFKATGQGTVGETDDTTENALIQQMNPYIRDVICTYYAAQTLVSMMVPGFDEVAKVRVFAAGEESGQVVYVPDEVGSSGASNVKRKAWYEAKIAVLVAGQMAERYLYGPDKVSQFGNLDMREATALACEMVMMHGWSDIGPICVLRADSTEEKYLKGGVNKGSQTGGMDSGRTRGKLWGIPPGKDGTLAEGRKAKYKEEPGLELQMELSDELDMLIANEVRKIFIKACQRAVMIMHDPKGTEMLFTLREALGTAKEVNGPNLRAVFKKFGLHKPPNFDLWDINWGKNDELYWDEFTEYIWADDASSTTFWKLVSDQWRRTVADPTASVVAGDGSNSVPPDVPEWAKEFVRSLPVGGQEEMLMYAPKEVQDRVRDGKPAVYTGPGFGTRDARVLRGELDDTIPAKPTE